MSDEKLEDEKQEVELEKKQLWEETDVENISEKDECVVNKEKTKDFTENSSAKMIVTIILSLIVLVLSQILSQILGSVFYVLPTPNWIGNIVAGISYVVLTYYLLKMFCAKSLKEELSTYKITKISIKPLWIAIAIVLPVAVTAIYMTMPGSFFDNELTFSEIMNNVTIAVFYSGLGAGIVEEMVFRGMIMTAIEKKWGKISAILIPSVLFGILHISGADMSNIGIVFLLIAGTAVGIMFSMITYENNNIWNSAIVHAIWNFVIIGGILSIGAEGNTSAMYAYNLKSDSLLITGSDFGIEASVISTIGYILVSLIAYILYSRKNKVHEG